MTVMSKTTNKTGDNAIHAGINIDWQPMIDSIVAITDVNPSRTVKNELYPI
jgi:hypothetical protein